MSGLVKYEKNPDYKTKRQQAKQQKEKEQDQQSYGYGGGYVAPDANLDADTFTQNTTGSSSGSKREALKNLGAGVYNKLKDVDKDNLPVRIQLADESVLKKRAKASKGGLHPSVTDNDPNKFDYDLDELIAEEQEKDARELKESVARANQGFSDV
ncbi:unnamed protein product [Ambrosiozyma monospora]|uniref:Unnamed protein product n=1 Tax=Ambrosiozyma monospora TaxID=43982 RepID=A0ACB5SRZ3_AMBMO|nr:unnamed protein product [Ambrosiozyma monospora]